jgi:hypothetical protein
LKVADSEGLHAAQRFGEAPDPARLESYPTHAGQRRGHWPTSSEMTAAMFERYNKKPSPENV